MNERRKTLIIKGRFQNRLILQSILSAFLLVNIILIISFLLPRFGLSRIEYEFILAVIVAVIEIAALGFFYFYSRKFSLRAAGPIYRLEQSLKAVSEGDLTVRINLRKKDYFQVTAQIFNEATESLSRRIESIQKSIEELMNETASDDPRKEIIGSLHRQLGEFKTEDQPLEKSKTN